MRVDAAPPAGRLSDEEPVDRVTAALAVLRGDRRATVRTRMDAARWLLNTAFGPPPEGDPAPVAETDAEEQE